MPVTRPASINPLPVPSIVPCGVPTHQIPTATMSPAQKASVSHRRAQRPRACGRTAREVGPNVVLRVPRTGGGGPTTLMSPVEVAGAGSTHGGAAGRRPVTITSYQTPYVPDKPVGVICAVLSGRFRLP